MNEKLKPVIELLEKELKFQKAKLPIHERQKENFPELAKYQEKEIETAKEMIESIELSLNVLSNEK